MSFVCVVLGEFCVCVLFVSILIFFFLTSRAFGWGFGFMFSCAGFLVFVFAGRSCECGVCVLALRGFEVKERTPDTPPFPFRAQEG